MITQESIDQVKAATNIEEVIGDYVKLTKSGANYKACCPLHGEQSPSFYVTPAKAIFKCFGCGQGGDAIKFLQLHQNFDYPSAVRHLAIKYNISLEETAFNQEDALVVEKKTSLYLINAGVNKYYQQELKKILETQPNHWVTTELYSKRNFSDETIADMQIGYAPEGWNFLSNIYTETDPLMGCKELGLIKDKSGKTYDVFRDRLMFPFIDKMGRVVGFSGRKSSLCEDKENPKFFNSYESMLFKKSKVFYGIHTAEREIRKQGVAILVEGQADVCQMQQAGMLNTIAASGTAFTTDHAKELKRLCNTAIILTDGDEAGLKSALKTIDILIEEGLHPEVVRLPKGEDPDSYIRMLQAKIKLEGMESRRH